MGSKDVTTPNAGKMLSRHQRRAGQVLNGRYEIVDRLNAGAMSWVHKAWDRREKRFVAVKIALGRREESDDIGRLRREGMVLASLRHPRIPRAIDSFAVDDDGYGLVMEFFAGESLEKRLKRDDEGPLPIREAVTIAAETLEALQAAHLAGIVHRDVKPGNLMLTPEGAILIDFGVMLPVPRRRMKRYTEPGVMVGTPSYMSPEQCRDIEEIDGRADLFCLGLTLYRMLTGRSPYRGDDDVMSIINAQVASAPMPFGLSAPRLRAPRRLEAAVLRALEKRPRDRFRDAAEMREALLTAVR